MIPCLNCALKYEGKFCPQCGQKAATSRLTSHQIAHDLQHVLLHLDKGILKNMQTIWNPSLIRDYIAGKRVGFFNPIVFLLFVCGVVAFVEITFKIHVIPVERTDASSMTIGYKIGHTAAAFFHDWSKYLEAFLAIPFGFWSWRFFKHHDHYNLVENIYIQAFLVCNMNIIGLFFYPILRHLNPLISLNIYALLLMSLFNYLTFNHDPNLLRRAFKSVLTVLLAYIMYALVFLLVAFIAVTIKGD